MIATVGFGKDFRFSSFWRRQIKARRHNRSGIVVRDARPIQLHSKSVRGGLSVSDANFQFTLALIVPALHSD